MFAQLYCVSVMLHCHPVAAGEAACLCFNLMTRLSVEN